MALPPLSKAAAAAAAAAHHEVGTPSLRPIVGLDRTWGTGRRGLISFFLTSAAAIPEASDSKKSLLQEYLQRSRDNKAKNDKERLDDYYKRNYKDYFELLQGPLEGKDEQLLTETEKSILEWLRKNSK